MKKLAITAFLLFCGILVWADYLDKQDLANRHISPKQALEAVQILKAEGGIGLACMVGHTRALTANHMFKDPDSNTAMSPGRFWTVQQYWPGPDLAELDLEMGAEISNPAQIATSLPEPGSDVYYLVYIAKTQLQLGFIKGRFIAIDSEGDMLIDGNGQFGMSGGCVVNSQGELIGIMRAIGYLDQRASPFNAAVNLVGRKFF